MCWNMFTQSQKKFPNRTPEDIYSEIHDKYEDMHKLDGGSNNSASSLRAWELWYSDFKKEFLHVFFLDNKLREVLENIKIKVDNVKEFVKINGDSELMWSDKYNANIDVRIFCFGIHLPHIKNGFAFKLMLYDDLLITYCIKDDLGGFEISTDSYKYFQKTNDKNAKIKVKMFQLCINTVLYMDCYPECIFEGVPDEISSKEYKDRNFQLSVSKDFEEIISSGGVKSPHMRGAYFMTFKDKRYTKMRGKSVMVKAKFIKGEAITVETTNDFSRLEKL